MMTWPRWSHNESGTALGPSCHFGEVPDGTQERATERLGEPSHIFITLLITHRAEVYGGGHNSTTPMSQD